MQRHWAPLQQTVTRLVMWKDLLTGTWEGPDVLITWGRGYACVFPQNAETQSASQTDLFDPSTRKPLQEPRSKRRQKKS